MSKPTAGLRAININIEDDHGIIWFSTEDNRQFAVSFLKQLSLGPTAKVDPHSVKTLRRLIGGEGLDAFHRASPALVPHRLPLDLHHLQPGLLAHFPL